MAQRSKILLFRSFGINYFKKVTIQLTKFSARTINEIRGNFYQKFKKNIKFLFHSNEIYSLKKKIKYLNDYGDSLKYSAEIFKDLEHFTIFINPGRTGHSLIGALLDAHPNIIISHELDVLPFLIYHDFDIIKIYSRILSNSSNLANNNNRYQTGYNYNIPYKYAGSYKILKVIGDKKGGDNCVFLMRNPYFIHRLLKILGKKLKIISVFRNPYDNIVAMANNNNLSIKINISRYFNFIEVIRRIKNLLPEDQVFIFTLESLVNNPKKAITSLCHSFELEAPIDYLDACSQIIFKKPHLRRREIKWQKKDLDKIENFMKKEEYFEFFKDYKF